MIHSLEGIRGVAALIVALYHLEILNSHVPFVRHGYIFVDLFFVLSGFVICAAYFSRMESVNDFRSFMIRRFGRLFPLLVFSTLLYILAANLIVLAKKAAVAAGHAGMLNNPGDLQFLLPSAGELVSTFTLTHSLGIFDRLILNTPSWSISTEFYTYLLFALLCLVLPARRRLPVFAVVSVLGFIVSIWASVSVHDCLNAGGCLGATYDFGYLRCIFSFFLGALTFHASRRFPGVATRGAQWTAMVLITAGFLLMDRFPVVAFAFPFAFSLLVLGLSRDKGGLATLLQRKPFQVLGQRSYSIYMLHLPIVLFFENVAKRIDGILPNAILLACYVTVLLIASGWTYRRIEDPFRKMFNRIADSRRFGPTSATVAAKAGAE